MSLHLSATTLVPRPDTETIVERALEILRGSSEPASPQRIADIGTGSGAILLALVIVMARREVKSKGLHAASTWPFTNSATRSFNFR